MLSAGLKGNVICKSERDRVGKGGGGERKRQLRAREREGENMRMSERKRDLQVGKGGRKTAGRKEENVGRQV